MSILRILPFFSGTEVEVEGVEVSLDCSPISSLKLNGLTSLGEDGEARDTRLCFSAETLPADAGETGKGALNEKVDVDGMPFA